MTVPLMAYRVHGTCLPFRHHQTTPMGLRDEGCHGHWWEESRSGSTIEGTHLVSWLTGTQGAHIKS